MNAHFLAHCADSYAYAATVSLDEQVADQDGRVLTTGDMVIDPSPSVEVALNEVQLSREVRKFVLGLSPALRCIVVRHYWLGQSQTDIARALGVTRSAINHALARVYQLGFRLLSDHA